MHLPKKNKTWLEESSKKLVLNTQLENLVKQIRQKQKTIVSINGSFDLLHAGHLEMLFQASLSGDILIVALNSDDSIRRYKSPDRPIIPLLYRQQMMSALSFVDYVTSFNETDPREILSIIKPDVHINGSEYGHECIEKEVVEKNGGQIKIVNLVEGLSTTKIIKKIVDAHLSKA